MTDILTPTGQGLLQPQLPPAERLNIAGGLVVPEDLEWVVGDERSIATLAAYASAIGMRMAGRPRESSIEDSALELYGEDFRRARPDNLVKGLYYPHAKPRKSVVRVSQWRDDLNRLDYPGKLPFSTGVAVSPDIYEEIIKNAPFYANQIDNRTRRNHQTEPIIEDRVNLAGESVVYALSSKHEKMEERSAAIKEDLDVLQRVRTNAANPNGYRRIGILEPYRLRALTNILNMARVACIAQGYGTNQANDTLRAVTSNTHRLPAPAAARWWAIYSSMAIRYNTEVLGKVEQSIHSCVEEIGKHTEQLIALEDREYKQ